MGGESRGRGLRPATRLIGMVHACGIRSLKPCKCERRPAAMSSPTKAIKCAGRGKEVSPNASPGKRSQEDLAGANGSTQSNQKHPPALWPWRSPIAKPKTSRQSPNPDPSLRHPNANRGLASRIPGDPNSRHKERTLQASFFCCLMGSGGGLNRGC